MGGGGIGLNVRNSRKGSRSQSLPTKITKKRFNIFHPSA
jgi:hypothetical protein